MKKVICILLIALMSLSIFAGCASETAKPQDVKPTAKVETPSEQDNEPAPAEEPTTKEFENKELNIAIFQGGYGSEYWETVVQLFEEAYPGVKVNMTINPEIGEIIRPQIISGNPPDFISMNVNNGSGVVTSLIKERALLDITDVFEGKALNSDEKLGDLILDGLLDSTLYSPYKDGKVYLAPFNAAPMGLIYNKTLFDEKGWEVPETWDEFFALGDIAKEEGRALFTYQGIYPSYLEMVLYPSIASAGGMEALNKIEKYEEGAFDNESVKRVLDVLEKISSGGYLMEGTVALNHTQSQTDMMMGKALFIPNGNWMEGEMKEAPREDGFEFAMTAPPVFEKGDARYVNGFSEQFEIPAAAKNPELAKEFLRFLYTDASVEAFAEKANGVYALKGALELSKPYISTGVFNMFNAFNDAKAMVVNWDPLPKGSKIIINDTIFDKTVTQVMNGDMTTQEWIDIVEKDFAQIRKEIEEAK